MFFQELLDDERKEGRAEGLANGLVLMLEGFGEVTEELRAEIVYQFIFRAGSGKIIKKRQRNSMFVKVIRLVMRLFCGCKLHISVVLWYDILKCMFLCGTMHKIKLRINVYGGQKSICSTKRA